MKKSFYLSSGLHLLLLSLLIVPHCGGSSNEDSKKNGSKDDQSEIVEKGKDKSSSPQEIILYLGKPHTTQKGEDCPSGRWFGGIGIEHTFLDDKIFKVVPGYPAWSAGIKVGDVILGNLDAIKGEPGTPITVYVRRGIQILRFDMIRDKICVK